jgi:hypothetical protein
MKFNYVGGQWVAGASARANINPSDVSDVVVRPGRRGAD